MQWKLVNPPERGGLGISPDVAKNLPISEAIFYVESEESIVRYCRYMNRVSEGKTVLDERETLRLKKEELRKHFTGSDEL